MAVTLDRQTCGRKTDSRDLRKKNLICAEQGFPCIAESNQTIQERGQGVLVAADQLVLH